MQVNYDFYENLTVLKFDRILEDLDKGASPLLNPSSAVRYTPRPSRNTAHQRPLGHQGFTQIDVY